MFPLRFFTEGKARGALPRRRGWHHTGQRRPPRGEAGRTEHSGAQSSGRNGETQRWKGDRVRENRVCCLGIAEIFFGPQRGKRESENKNWQRRKDRSSRLTEGNPNGEGFLIPLLGVERKRRCCRIFPRVRELGERVAVGPRGHFTLYTLFFGGTGIGIGGYNWHLLP